MRRYRYLLIIEIGSAVILILSIVMRLNSKDALEIRFPQRYFLDYQLDREAFKRNLFESFDRIFNHHKFTGIAAVWDRGETSSKSWGDPAIAESSQFLVGSLAKQFVAATFILLEADKEVSLSTPVCTWVESFCRKELSKVTFEHLLNHTSGIQKGDFPSRWVALKTWVKSGHLPNYRQALIHADKIDMISKPGETFSYSNLGYQLAVAALEKVIDEKFSTIFETRITQPHNLFDTRFVEKLPDNNSIIPPHEADGELIQQMWMPMSVGADGLLTSVRDLIEWYRMIFFSNLAIAESVQSTLHRETKPYRFGFSTDENSYGKVFYSKGVRQGYAAGSFIFPQHELIIIYLIANDLDREAKQTLRSLTYSILQ